jgi:pimeloyl-ACP methyl ester carboxylesterase
MRIIARSADVEGTKLHYLMAGRGEPVILLHGYTQTSRMWRPLVPKLAERFRVIAPDLPGIGESGIPSGDIDMASAAARIRGLARSLDADTARVVGHDIGLMVAYAYAAQFPDAVAKLVLMDAFLPGVEGWEGVYNHPSIWHFRFNGPAPERLVRGRERTYFDSLWNGFAADPKRSVPEPDRRAYAAAYARRGRMRAGWSYFVSFPKSAKDFAELSRRRLNRPVLTIGGAKAFGELLGQQAMLVASDVTKVVLNDAGHWLLEERASETTETLLRFL